MKIVLLENIHPAAAEKLKNQGYDVHQVSGALSGKELVDTLKDAHAVGLRSKTQLTEDVIAQCPNLNVIGAFCIGTNQIHLDRANGLGIPVFNAPYSNTRSVAELVLAEVIALSRSLGEISMAAHLGRWEKSAKGNNEVRGKTLGIVGYGHIGSQLSVLAEAVGLNVCFYDIIKKLPLGNATAMDSLEDLLATSDFVTLHVPATEDTRQMMGRKQLDMMKKGSYLINASRGSVVVIDELAEALKSGHIAGAAVDVFPTEPKNNQEEFESPLRGLPNVILTPHIGGSTEEAQYNIGQEVSDSLVNYLSFGSTSGAVNFPVVEPRALVEGRRILNVHRNEPGALGEINSIVSEMGVNIEAQYLSTDNRIGYLVMDVLYDKVEHLGERIAGLDKSLRTRVV